MTPTSKAEGHISFVFEQRIHDYWLKWSTQEHITEGWLLSSDAAMRFAAFVAESEAALARKEEREAILKIVRNSGVEAGTWGEEAVRDEITSEIRKRSQEEGR